MKTCCLGDCTNTIMESSKVGACEEHEEFVIKLDKEQQDRYFEERWEDHRNDIKQGIQAGNVF